VQQFDSHRVTPRAHRLEAGSNHEFTKVRKAHASQHPDQHIDPVLDASMNVRAQVSSGGRGNVMKSAQPPGTLNQHCVRPKVAPHICESAV
jgi:hypothetical protein